MSSASAELSLAGVGETFGPAGQRREAKVVVVVPALHDQSVADAHDLDVGARGGATGIAEVVVELRDDQLRVTGLVYDDVRRADGEPAAGGRLEVPANLVAAL